MYLSGSSVQRLCLATGALKPISQMIRFTVKENRLCVDHDFKHQGRGAWVSCQYEAVKIALKNKAFQRSFKSSVHIEPDLQKKIPFLLKSNVFDHLSLLKKQNYLLHGYMDCHIQLKKKKAGLLIHSLEADKALCEKLNRFKEDHHHTLFDHSSFEILHLFNQDALYRATNIKNFSHGVVCAGKACSELLLHIRRMIDYG